MGPAVVGLIGPSTASGRDTPDRRTRMIMPSTNVATLPAPTLARCEHLERNVTTSLDVSAWSAPQTLHGCRIHLDAAVEQGLHTIGISDHSPFFAEPDDRPKPWVAMAKSQFDDYLAEAFRLRDEYRGRINVLVGVESDFFPEYARLYQDVYSAHPLDYVIGSVHVMDGVDLFQPDRFAGLDRRELTGQRAAYCDLVAASARSGMFDVIGHVDGIKATCPEMEGLATPAVDRMVRAIAESDVVMEINTSGNTKDCGGWYPGPELLEHACRRGVKVTFGSDAHVPGRIGEDFEQVRRELHRLGYRRWHVFDGRKRIDLPL